MTAVRLWGSLEDLGQLICQLCQVVTARGEGLDADGAGHPPEGGLQKMPPGDRLQRVDDGVVSPAVGSTQFFQQGCDHSALACSLGAMNNTVPTWGSIGLLICWSAAGGAMVSETHVYQSGESTELRLTTRKALVEE